MGGWSESLASGKNFSPGQLGCGTGGSSQPQRGCLSRGELFAAHQAGKRPAWDPGKSDLSLKGSYWLVSEEEGPARPETDGGL